jgi:hypothetical protein
MYGYVWLERQTAALLVNWQKVNEQMVQEATSQTSAYFNPECHDNVQE